MEELSLFAINHKIYVIKYIKEKCKWLKPCWLKETNTSFLRIAIKHPCTQFLNNYDKPTAKFFFLTKCYEKMKI